MVEFAGIAFRGLTLDDVLSDHQGLRHVLTVNAEYIVRANKNERFRQIVNGGMATFDGQVPYLVARFLCRGRCRFDKIPGSELVYEICRYAAKRNERVFLLGGMEASNADAVSKLRARYPGLAIDGFSPPFSPYPFPVSHNKDIMRRLAEFHPHCVLVGFGAPKQDYWIHDNRVELESMGVSLAVGVGGTFEMVSGKIKRAPRLVQQMGLEGVYRFVKEPKAFRLRRLAISLQMFRYL